MFKETDINFSTVLAAVLRHKYVVAVTATAGAAVLLGISLLIPNVYRAEILLAPNLDRAEISSLSLASRYSGLASLAGIDLADAGGTETALGLEVLQSRKFLIEFIAARNLLPSLMAASEWDPESGKLLLNSAHYDEKTDTWSRPTLFFRSAKPTNGEAYDELKSRMTVLEDGRSGFVTILLDHVSPELAARWLNDLVADLNATIMTRDVTDASNSIRYLEGKLAETALADLRSVFFELIEEQMRVITLANISGEYLFRVVDPATVPEVPFRPKRLLLALLGCIGGAGLGAIVAVFLATRNRRET